MSDEEDAEFQRLFLAESAEQLDRLADTVLQLERAGGGADLVATLFRDAHTLKSSAALMGHAVVAELAHALEDLLGELRSGARPASSGLADGVLEVVDAMRALVLAGPGAPGEAGYAAAARAGLARAAAGDAAPAPRPPEEAGADADAGAAPGAAAPGADDPPAPGARETFAAEVAPVLERLATVARELGRDGPEPARVEELLRSLQALEGAAGMAGFGEVADLARRLAQPLAELGPGTGGGAPAVAEALLAILDAIRAATPDLVAGHDETSPLAPARATLDALEAAVPAGLAAAPPVALPASSARPAGPDAGEAERGAPAGGGPGERLVPVGLDRLDGLVRLSGEAVAAGLRLSHLLRDHIAADAEAEAAALELRRVLAGVQQQTMRTRMTTLAGIAGPLRRVVRDVARASGKEVDYALEGERVELDRAVLDGLRDPLLHLVRNAVDHGLERPEARVGAGKPPVGTVRVRAERRGPEITVTVSDDGAGLDLGRLREVAGAPELDDEQAADLVFRPGLSTADAVTDFSGRGVGLDAVRSAVAEVRGRVEVGSAPGRGCRFTVTVPLTLAVLPCVLLEAGGARYHVPTHAAVSLVGDGRDAEVGLEGGSGLWVGGDVVPVFDLRAVLGDPGPDADGPALVLGDAHGARHAFRVDAVLGQRDVAVKELGGVTPATALVAGASIEPDGSVVLVLDPAALAAAAGSSPGAPRPGDRAGAPSPAGPPGEGRVPEDVPATPRPPAHASILVVDDALTVRELQRSILERAGYHVRLAVDGADALEQLSAGRPDLVITDVEMPRLDGHGLATAIRTRAGLESLPILMVTSRAGDEDRRRGLAAGADAYIVKQDFTADALLAAVARLLGTRT